tara:strand:+ start:207 stop:686 length:480 start_codon:yes stop_codon:yes gene_type:complete
MLYLVFDLDETLYQTPNKYLNNYSDIEYNRYLPGLLKKLPLKKIIFTNGTENHAFEVLNILKIRNKFHNIEARDTLSAMKPDPTCFERFKIKNNIKQDDYVIFFEDSISNLYQAKKQYGPKWLTFYIGPFDHSFLPFVDKSYPNINEALRYLQTKYEEL